MVLIETLEPEKLKVLYASFAKIAPVRILMKVADSRKLPSGIPENIKSLPWMPQQPVLGDSIKSFFF